MFWFKKKSEISRNTMVRQQIVWFEIPASNFNRAVAFYNNVFGFTINEIDLNDTKYGIFVFGEGKISGAIVDSKNTEIKGGTILFFDANPSISELGNRIKQNGGQILIPKTLIKNQVNKGLSILPNNHIDGSNIGYFAYFLDTEGNKMGLYSNS